MITKNTNNNPDTSDLTEEQPAIAEEAGTETDADATVVTESLLTRITAMKIERKLIDIATAEAKVPLELKADAAQEIRLAWHKAKVKVAFSFGETASYAHRIALHAALRTWRELGSTMRLPGSAFRKKKDGTTHVNPGILAAPIDISEVEDRLVYGEEASSTLICAQDLELVKKKLTPRQGEIITMMAEGYSFSEIQNRLNLKKSAMQRHLAAIRLLAV
jgi:DNA-binding NarL/FixJ family response regulator